MFAEQPTNEKHKANLTNRRRFSNEIFATEFCEIGTIICPEAIGGEKMRKIRAAQQEGECKDLLKCVSTERNSISRRRGNWDNRIEGCIFRETHRGDVK
jgi:hypothetical protein